mgnify:CR=1 FL=1
MNSCARFNKYGYSHNLKFLNCIVNHGARGKEFGTNLSNFEDFMTLNFLKIFGFSASFLFIWVPHHREKPW